MAYLRPGVYVDETLKPISTNDSPTTEFVGAFIGENPAGPDKPMLISSWSEFTRYYGGLKTGSDLLPLAVYQYFANGGGKCYVARAVPSDSTKAEITLDDRQEDDGSGTAGPQPVLRVISKMSGTCGNTLAVTIEADDDVTGSFNFLVSFNGTVVDRFNEVSMDPTSPRNAVSLINSTTYGSQYVTLESELADDSAWTVPQTPAVVQSVPLEGGVDGTETPDLPTTAYQLDGVPYLLNMNFPGVTDDTLSEVIKWAEYSRKAFIFIDTPLQTSGTTSEGAVYAYESMSPISNVGTTPPPLYSSSYAAIYGPWLECADPLSSTVGATRMMSPAAAVIGVAARIDREYGPYRTPGGEEAYIRNAVRAEYRFTDTQLDSLNQSHVNVIRELTGAGFCIMGGRTLKKGYPDRYVAVRRLLMYLTEQFVQTTRFALFEANTPTLWHTLSTLLKQLLQGIAQAGWLMGTGEGDGYVVVCDETNNTTATVDNGEVHIDVGLALARPAEFIAIHISQYDGGTSVEEASA
ncbi:hypothetical protein [Streptomyces sp. NBC_00470]|uniref:hypothetical protein n=1 Tax=Streptomyces sp. NBC_00470 TaxID=2975753 RepID=UPI0030E29B94